MEACDGCQLTLSGPFVLIGSTSLEKISAGEELMRIRTQSHGAYDDASHMQQQQHEKIAC